MTAPFCAAVDWGTSSFRLWLFAPDGSVMAERRSGEGMLTARERGFAAILEAHLSAAGAPASLPVAICGMAGAKQGWREAGYVDAPARLDALIGAATRFEEGGRDIRILPGIAQRSNDRPDVMRGEETQLIGLAAQGTDTGLVCMPGTHSKWVALDGGTVEQFSTYMTGELFSLLQAHSILRLTIGEATASADAPAFEAAVRAAFGAPQEATNRLFWLRAASLLETGARQGGEDAAAALSGLLIGLELAGAKSRYGDFAELTLVAGGELARFYSRALQSVGATPKVADADTCVRLGLWNAARTFWP